jgi:hypothetical protein
LEADKFLPIRASTPAVFDDAQSADDANVDDVCEFVAHASDVNDMSIDLDASISFESDDNDDLTFREMQQNAKPVYTDARLTVGQHKKRMLELASELKLSDRQLEGIAKYMATELLPIQNSCPTSVYLYKKSEMRLFSRLCRIFTIGEKHAEYIAIDVQWQVRRLLRRHPECIQPMQQSACSDALHDLIDGTAFKAIRKPDIDNTVYSECRWRRQQPAVEGL